MVTYTTKGDKTGIWAEITCSQSPATGEWDSGCNIYHRDRMIGGMAEGDEGITIRGAFDHHETGKCLDIMGMEDTPECVDNALYLTIPELQKIIKIIESWEDDELDKDIWEEVQ